MKKNVFIMSAMIFSSLAFSQVGINTPDPSSTLDITAKNATGTSANVDGLLIPRVDRQRAQSMINVPISTLIYVDSITTGTTTGTAVNIDAVGYYYFNGTEWIKMNEENTNIYNSNGTLTAGRTVTMEGKNLTFRGTTGAFTVDTNNNGMTRTNFLNSNTEENSRKDIRIGAGAGNIYLGVDNGSAIFGAGAKGYLDNRSGGPFAIGRNGAEQMRIMTNGTVGIGTTAPDESAIVDMSSTNKGFLPPRMTTAQRDVINNKAAGLMIYNTDLNCMQYWNTAAWVGDCAITPAPGTIVTLNCAGATNNGVLTVGLAASGVSSVIPYTGGNGGFYNGQTVTSTGVPGLTATLSAGSFANGNGTLTYTITGTPSIAGIANFAINIGGRACTLTFIVASGDSNPPTPDLSANCIGWKLPWMDNNTSVSGTINGIPVTATFSDYKNVSQVAGSNSSCGVSGGKFGIQTALYYLEGSMKIKFNREVSNFKVFHTGAGGEDAIQYILKNKGTIVKPKIIVSTTNGCPQSFTIDQNNTTVLHNNNPSSINDGLIYVLGDVWFDEIEIAKIPNKAMSLDFDFCIGNTR